MSVQDYMSALKIGKREYNANVKQRDHIRIYLSEKILCRMMILDSEISLGCINSVYL